MSACGPSYGGFLRGIWGERLLREGGARGATLFFCGERLGIELVEIP